MMRVAAVVLVALLGVVSVISIDEQRWWIALRPEAESAWNYDQLARLSFDSRGSYRFFELVVATKAEVQLLKQLPSVASVLKLTPYVSSEQVWVVECFAEFGLNLVSQVSEAIRQLGAVPRSLLNHTAVTSIVVVGDVANLAGQFVGTNVIPVPTQSVKVAADPNNNPAFQKFDSGSLAPDPLVQQLVAAVKEENVKNTDLHLSNYLTRLSISPTVLEAQKWLEGQYSGLGLAVSLFPFQPGYGSNVIAELKGSEDPSKIVVIGAHYDSRSTDMRDVRLRAPGADDNGSGTSAVLELARVFAESGIKFKHTIRFASWCGEEQGLVGSRAYASKEARDKANIIAAINLDMIGYRRPGTSVSVALVTRLTTPWLTTAVEEIIKTYLPGFAIVFSTACCSDQQSFIENGFPAMSFFETPGAFVVYPQYHKSTDLPEFLDFTQMGLITKAAAASLASLAEPISSNE